MDQTDYVYHDPPNPLPEGHYSFTVIDIAGKPYTSSNGNLVLPIKLAIGPEKVPLYDNPGAGVTPRDGNPYDTIAAFLKCIGRNPRPGEQPNLSKSNLVGARGELMLKVKAIQKGSRAGMRVNRVHCYIWDDPNGTFKAGPRDEESPDSLPNQKEVTAP